MKPTDASRRAGAGHLSSGASCAGWFPGTAEGIGSTKTFPWQGISSTNAVNGAQLKPRIGSSVNFKVVAIVSARRTVKL